MQPMIQLDHLKKYFKTGGGMLHAVDDVSLSINKGETMGIVGESGCGKSTLGRTILHLYEATDGKISFEGRDITHVNGAQLKALRKEMQLIFQDPYSSLNPRKTVEQTLREPLMLHTKMSRAELDKRTEELMDLVGIDRQLRLTYPHELDGGRRQRVGIGRALALKPKFIVCDEPVSALDVSIQAQVLNLLMDLQDEMGLTYMFITHNLAVVRHISTNITVMYLGQLVESCETDELFEHTLHPYTKALLSAIPTTDVLHPRKKMIIKGEVTSPINPPEGCRFASRCEYANEECKKPQVIEEVIPGHFVSCARVRELNGI